MGDQFLEIVGDQLKKWWVTFWPIFNVVSDMSPVTPMVANPLGRIGLMLQFIGIIF